MHALGLVVFWIVLTCSAQAQTFSFGAAGDHSARPQTTATFAEIRQADLDFFLSLGDLGYGREWPEADPRLSPEEAWCNGVKRSDRLGSSYPIQLTVGNHEDDWSQQCRPEQGHILNYIECLPEPPELRLIDEGDYGVQYYFDYPLDNPIARFIMLGAGLRVNDHRYDYRENDSDYDWVASKMQEARDRGLPWIIVGMHKPCMSMGNKTCRHTPAVQAGNCEDVRGEDPVDLSPLYDLLLGKQNGLKADLILAGDDHNYQRSHQLALSRDCPGVRHDDTDDFSACVAHHSPNDEYIKGNGSVFVIAGTGGINLRNLRLRDQDRPFFAAWDDDAWGFLRVDVSRQELRGRFVRSAGERFTDSFKIVNPVCGVNCDEWVAYNDLNAAGAANAEHVTSHPYDGSGNLVDFDTGELLPVIIENTIEGGAPCEKPVASTGGNTASGTDADLVFGGIINLQGMDELERPECKARIMLRNLDPSKLYQVTLTANRDNPRYENARYTRVTIEGADEVTQASSLGVVVNSEASVSFSTGFNRENGYVARWNHVKSGNNGRFSIVSEWDQARGRGRANSQGYAMAALRLEQINDEPPPPTWVAYNDMLQAGSANAPHVTHYTYEETGELINVDTGDALPVTVRGRIEALEGDIERCQLAVASTGGNVETGTDAHAVFGGVVNLQGMNELEHDDCRAHLQFSGLDPSKTYTVTLTANRDNVRYENARFTRVTIEGASEFTQASSPGVVVNHEASVSFSTGYNTLNGYVARWTGVTAADGTFEIVSQWETEQGRGNRNTQGYAMAAFRLEEHP
ncbi:MAG: hypothetical protein ETSY1_32550 [Candidatus Entotheonella factor]|uniref:Calcineurin-like phosphoesterase domain-containing protein n=2 Tax=Candidatus Entotheonella TaxID=93171 RepID=W4LB75_ENTF1|nr:MAG: hypothetical protein ETSY1_32550 [Candidatus Entotheonella factor]